MADSPADLPARPLSCVHYLPTLRLDHGGVPRAVLKWCAALAGRGCRMTLLACGPRDIPPDWFAGSAGLPRAVVVAPPGRLGRFPARSAAVAREVLRGADVLHLHAPWLPGNNELGGAAVGLGVPYLVSCHGMLDDWPMTQRGVKKRAYMGWRGRRFLEAAARVHCTARAELSQASKWLGRSRPVVLPYLIGLSSFRKLPGPEPARRAFPAARRPEAKVLFLSRLHEKKGVDLLIQSAAELLGRSARFVLLVAGTGEPGYRRRLEERVRRLGLGNVVEFLGHVDGVEKISLLQSADVLALPTHQENFGLVLPEALACGTPVVTTRGVDVWQEIESAGGVIADRSPAGFADAIERLLADPTASRARGERGRRWVLREWDDDKVARSYERLYAEVAGGEGAVGRGAGFAG